MITIDIEANAGISWQQVRLERAQKVLKEYGIEQEKVNVRKP